MTTYSLSQNQIVIPATPTPDIVSEHPMLELDQLSTTLPHYTIKGDRFEAFMAEKTQSVDKNGTVSEGLSFDSDLEAEVDELKILLVDETGSSSVTPFGYQTRRMSRDVSFHEVSAQNLGEEAIQRRLAYAAARFRQQMAATIVYGSFDLNAAQNAWNKGWPHKLSLDNGVSFTEMYDVTSPAPPGMVRLIEEQGQSQAIFGADAADITLDLVYQGLSRVQSGLGWASYLVMNIDMLNSLALICRQAGAPLTEKLDEGSKQMLYHFDEIPILISNFVASYDNNFADAHPENFGGTATHGTSSIFVLHVDHDNPLQGVCVLYPESFKDGAIRAERMPSRDREEILTYRLSLEFALYMPSRFDIGRIHSLGLKFVPQVTFKPSPGS